jgi:hypothetical protein
MLGCRSAAAASIDLRHRSARHGQPPPTLSSGRPASSPSPTAAGSLLTTTWGPHGGHWCVRGAKAPLWCVLDGERFVR